MSTTASSIQAGFEPIPGYVLRNKLGAGGYGEVWLADAPGGLKKAIKFVHGNIDEDRAAGELKSLQRIRQVNHPFILSLERIEVIDGQLIIVTELAQGSLHDRYIDFRQKGFVGIVRERLMGYMKDTADGLDFLCQEHDLQHLDVKPANLLLVADRVKVADFGLIKDIQSNSLSVMGGLTPTYAAPEMFDGRPGRFSDQYSLAIVYQELLSGTLPFRGRTTAQLANEHLNKAPNLESIPLLERPILSKALAKRPQLRFSDCREFINALERVHSTTFNKETSDPADATPNARRQAARSNGSANAKRAQSISPSQIQRARKPSDKLSQAGTESHIQVSPEVHRVEVLPLLLECEDDSDWRTQSNNLPSKRLKVFIIGLGETGARSLMGMRQRIHDTNPERLTHEQLGFLLVDSDQTSIESALEPTSNIRLPYHSTVLIPLKSPQYYRQNVNLNFPQLSRRWVYNIPRSLKTEGVRPLGMLAFLDNVTLVFEAIQDAIVDISKSNGDDLIHDPIRVQIVSSAHGGTGSAIATEIGFLIRQFAAELEIQIDVELILTCATPNAISSTDLTTASALSCLMEINHYFKTEGLHPSLDQIPTSRAINQPPFDHVSLIHGGQCGNARDWEAAAGKVSDYLWACIDTELGPRVLKARQNKESPSNEQKDREWTPWLGTLNCRSLDISTKIDPMTAATRLCLRVLLPWLSALNDAIEMQSSNQVNAVLTDSKIIQKMDFFVQDMFRNNHWNAQAWVRECMVILVPAEDENTANENENLQTASYDSQPGTPILSANSNEPTQLQSPSIDCNLTKQQLEELEHVCGQLALDINSAARKISKQIVTMQDSLTECLARGWLTSPTACASLSQVTRLIASKFSVNANSLDIVSEKLALNHDELLEKLYSGEQKETPKFGQKLHAMALESRFHSMGANMLSRMAEHMSHVENLWMNECKILHSELGAFIDNLTNNLGVRLENSPKSDAFIAELLQSDHVDAASKDVRISAQILVTNRLMATLGSSQHDSRQSKQFSLADIFEIAAKSFANSQSAEWSSPKDEALTTDSLMKASDEQLNPLTTSKDSVKMLTAVRDGSPKTTSVLEEEIGGLNERSLELEIDSTRPYFVEFGGAIRSIAILPVAVLEQLDFAQKATLEERSVSVILNKHDQRTSLICLGERMVLSDILDRVWMPSDDIWNLANRVLSRVDVDWLPVNP